MLDQISSSKSSTFIIVALVIGAVGGFFVSSSSLQPKIRVLEEQCEQLTTERNALTSDVETLEVEAEEHTSLISALEANHTDIQSETTRLQVEVSELRIIAATDPSRITWNKIGGTTQDTVQSGDAQPYQGIASLGIHEDGDDSENCRAETDGFQGYSSFILEASLLIDGGSESRAAIKLKNENQQHTISITCIIDGYWAYLSADGWIEINGLPNPNNMTWYQMKIIGDGELDQFKVSIDDSESDWIPSEKSWETIDYVEFRGNANYPSDAWLENVAIVNNIDHE